MLRSTLLSSPLLPLSLLGLGDLLMVADVLPHAASFALAALAVAFIAFARRNDALLFTIAAVPLSPALPIPGFETFALWRLTVAAFAVRAAIDYRRELAAPNVLARLRKAFLPHEWIGLSLLTLGALSLAVAESPTAGIRKLVFLGTIAVLYATLRVILPRDPLARRATILGLLTAFGILLFVGIAQYILVEFISLYDFWQMWTFDVIPVFYGEALGQTLSVSNTWFSYYAESPPTLRMFSLLPDSHSFGVLMLLGFLFAVSLFIERREKINEGRGGHAEKSVASPSGHGVPTERRDERGRASSDIFLAGKNGASFRGEYAAYPRWVVATLLVAFGLAVLLNGSRGIWLSAVPTAFFALFFLVEGQDRGLPALTRAAKSATSGMMLLFLLFPAASIISSRAYGAGIDEAAIETAAAFSRAKSIFDTEETSNRGRLDIWKAGLRSVRERPLLGVGLGNTAVALGEEVSAARRGASAHNLYLDFAVETGALGGILAIGFFFALVVTLGGNLIRRAANPILALPFALAVAWIGVYNLFDVILLNDRVLIAFLVFLALAVTHFRAAQAFRPAKD